MSLAESEPQSLDEAAFTALFGKHRRELQVHCYRMLGSFEDAEDLVQETFLRAWRKRDTSQGRSTFRAWLYRIATNACLDFLDRHPRVPRRPGSRQSPDDIPWLQPYPDRLLEPAAASDAEPDTAVVEKETIELAFLIAIQYLPPRQRAVLVLRDVLGWPSGETSSAVAELLYEDVRVTMPMPAPCDAGTGDPFWLGRDAFVAALGQVLDPASAGYVGQWRTLPTRANRQPAVAHYVRRPGDIKYRAQALEVLWVVDGRVAEITAFSPGLFPAFGLPSDLDP